MIYQVRILRRAQRDLVEIERYLAVEAGPLIADRVLDALLDAIERLDDMPERGAQPRDERLRRLGYRFLVVKSYLIFYKVLRTQVRVYRVLHGKRAYEPLL